MTGQRWLQQKPKLEDLELWQWLLLLMTWALYLFTAGAIGLAAQYTFLGLSNGIGRGLSEFVVQYPDLYLNTDAPWQSQHVMLLMVSIGRQLLLRVAILAGFLALLLAVVGMLVESARRGSTAIGLLPDGSRCHVSDWQLDNQGWSVIVETHREPRVIARLPITAVRPAPLIRYEDRWRVFARLARRGFWLLFVPVLLGLTVILPLALVCIYCLSYSFATSIDITPAPPSIEKAGQALAATILGPEAITAVITVLGLFFAAVTYYKAWKRAYPEIAIAVDVSNTSGRVTQIRARLHGRAIFAKDVILDQENLPLYWEGRIRTRKRRTKWVELSKLTPVPVHRHRF